MNVMVRSGITVLAAVSLLISCTRNSGSFQLINGTSEPIASASVQISGHTIDVGAIPPNGSAKRSYRITSDSHYVVSIKFQSGNVLTRELGYVTPGIRFHHVIVVTNDDIRITDTTTD